jgi:rubrerythrin
MITFPVLQSLTIENYGLFPASKKQPFVVTFQPGANAVIGINGSGKTTLINIIMRCLTGPYNLPSATSGTEFGQVRPRVVHMPRRERHVLGERVADGAESAIATIVVGFGGKAVVVKRRLSDLALVSFSIEGQDVNLTKRASSTNAEDSRYQDEIVSLFGLASFFDVLIVLHFLVFMLEDRRALVWDSNAQRQIFRVLLLPAARATEHAKAQQDVVSADSAVRNTRSLITRHQGEKYAAKARGRLIAEAEAERHVLVAQANVIREEIETTAANRSRADTDRHNARLDRLRGAEARDSLRRELERIKMATLGTQLGPSQDTLRYILGQLLADKTCVVCGTNPSPAETQIHNWVQDGRCPVCGSTHETPERVFRLSDIDRKRLPRLEAEIQLVSWFRSSQAFEVWLVSKTEALD